MINLNQMVSVNQVTQIIDDIIKEAPLEFTVKEEWILRRGFAKLLGTLLHHAVELPPEE